MMTSSNGNVFRVTGPLCGEFTGPRRISHTKASDDLRLNKRLSKQPWGWWFEMPSCSLWRHRNNLSYPLKATSITSSDNTASQGAKPVLKSTHLR